MKTLSAIIATLVLTLCSANALTLIQSIDSPAGCPDNLKITVKQDSRNDDLLEVFVSFTPHEPDLYKGRVAASCALTVKRAGETITRVRPIMTRQKGGQWRCRFALRKDCFDGSELGVGSMLHEKDGIPTIGGGENYEIALKEFAPNP